MTDMNPISGVTLESLYDLFGYLDANVDITVTSTGPKVVGCNGTHRQVREWSTFYGLNSIKTDELVELLEQHGGYCDCEVLFSASKMLLSNDSEVFLNAMEKLLGEEKDGEERSH